MPRIQAATLAEHREAQRRALLDAARAILIGDPARPPTLTEVAARAGLARSSVYQYFSSRDQLLAELLADTFPQWARRVSERMAAASGPAEQVLEYVRVNLELVASGEHALARVLSTVIDDDIAAYSHELHEELRTPLIAALGTVGAPDPAATAGLIDGIVYAASRMLESGQDVDRTVTAATELVAPYLSALLPSEAARR
ncbi:TetR/AcrR family transcriptional regulator [Nocardia niigatensis]|uniref:TetR/AcrR family transcriptional regulator n=1 Tax=Nocardia niigatensis TaxID=209249 RepID=UPI0002F7A04A|nr:TetR/AcrR family transcriptional regulator [Nocardia niigatensis]